VTLTFYISTPSWNSMSMVNISETCAATRLIQCSQFGISTNNISRKFRKTPDEATDLSEEEFYARQVVLDRMDRWCKNTPVDETRVMWTPILYYYEVMCSSRSVPLIGKTDFKAFPMLTFVDRESICKARGVSAQKICFAFCPHCLRSEVKVPRSATGDMSSSQTGLSPDFS
jgi:hypothetical protein